VGRPDAEWAGLMPEWAGLMPSGPANENGQEKRFRARPPVFLTFFRRFDAQQFAETVRKTLLLASIRFS
jgi:hypothetical protein